MLKAAGVPHVGTRGIRHRSTTDIANSGVPTKVGMRLTGHKTVAMFVHYVHTEDKPVRDAAGLVACRRLAITGVSRTVFEANLALFRRIGHCLRVSRRSLSPTETCHDFSEFRPIFKVHFVGHGS